MRFPWGDPRFDTFRDMLERVHLNAECAPGFVCRYRGESTDAGYIRAFGDPLCMGNLSVWESRAELHDFVFKDPAHRQLMTWRGEWFEKPTEPHFVTWLWAPGVAPTLAHAEEVLAAYRRGEPMAGVEGW